MYHSKKVDEVLRDLGTSMNGLTSAQAAERLEKYGKNELVKGKETTAFDILFNQFKNALIVLLVFAVVLSLFLGERIEAIAIAVIIFMNVILGFIQEYKAEKAMQALEKISAPNAVVIRDGTYQTIAANLVVPGDILVLEAGNILAADSRIIEASNLQIDEAMLTGESTPSKKVIAQFSIDTTIADQENMAFMSSIVTYGKGKSVVVETGMKTEFGKIAKSLEDTKEMQTPLQKKFSTLSQQIGIITIFLIAAVFIFSMINKTLSVFDMIIFSLALTVSTIPSSLPIIVTVSLSKGAARLSKKNMLIKKLPAAEALGAATIICSDKTGTITKNQMTITDIYFDNEEIKVTGSGYNPKGNFHIGGSPINPKKLDLLFKIGYLCNNSKLVNKDGEYKIIGDPTEGSLIVLAKKGQLDEEEIEKDHALLDELPFDSDRKRMSVIYKNHAHHASECYTKGAPDLLLKKCTMILDKGKTRHLNDNDRKKILELNERYADNALRLLAVAYRDVSHLEEFTIENVEKDLTFVGLVGMIDPAREEVKDAIAKCSTAGIKVVIITGDHAITTKAVAREIGLFKEGDIVLTGEELDRMNDDELDRTIDKIRIIARALPIQKLRIVDALQKKGHIVAMTGDGVNDAPALKKADIGIAMGITGTDVAKEVAKATLTDDNFATIVNAIAEGRDIYDKMIKSAKYLLSCNCGEIISVFVAIMLNFPLPLLPLQVLMMNLLTDNFPALGLGTEKSEKNIMERPPRNPKEKPISNRMLISIVFFGLIMGLSTFYIFTQYEDTNLEKARTMAFTTLVIFQMFAVLSSRSLYTDFKRLNPFTNLWLLGGVTLSVLIQILVIYWAPLQPIFGTTAISLGDWGKIIGISILGFIMMEISKVVLKFTPSEANGHKNEAIA